MRAHVLLNLLNVFGERDNMQKHAEDGPNISFIKKKQCKN